MTGKGTVPIRSFGSRGVEHLLEALERMGVDSGALCREAGLDPERLRAPRCRVDAQALRKIFALAEARSGDPLVGLHVAEQVRLGGLASYLIGSQNTVAHALLAQDRLQPLLLGAIAMSIRRRNDRTFVTLDMGPRPEAQRHLTEYCIASSCRVLRWVTLQAGRPSEIHFRHRAAGDPAEYERVFGCPVHFNMRENGAALSDATLAERLVSADDALGAQLDVLARMELGERPTAAFRDSVVLALRAGHMDGTRPRREAIARRLGVSARTLQRRLADEGTSFGKVVDETRYEAALELIDDPAVSIGDVSRRVGYADQFAFNKAFRRWTGRSPTAYRREVPRRGAR